MMSDWRNLVVVIIDYNPNAEESIAFFKQVQNKMHWAAHKHTAAEIVFERADAEKENMGLTSWEGKQIKKSDSEIAKNYLNDQELDALIRLSHLPLFSRQMHQIHLIISSILRAV